MPKNYIIKTFYYIILLSIGIFFTCSSQNNAAVLEKEISNLSTITDISILNQKRALLKKNATTELQSELDLIYAVFLGNLYASKHDGLNNPSTQLFKNAAIKATKSNNKALKTWVYSKTGFYFYSYNQYNDAYNYFSKSAFLLDELSDKELLDAAEVLKLNAYFFSTITEYDKSITYLNRALKLTPPHLKNHGDMLNALGNCYLNKGEVALAETYFEKTCLSAKKNKDTLRYAKALGDLAKVAIKHKNWQKGEKLLLEDIQISESNSNNRNAMYAKLQLGKLYLENGHYDKAYKTLTEARTFAASKSYLKGYEKETTELLLQIVLKQNKPQEELFLRRKIDSLNLLTQPENKANIDRLSFQIQKEKILWQLEAEKIKSEKALLQRWIWFLISLLLLAIAIFIYVLFKRRLKIRTAEFDKSLLIFKYEKVQSEKKLIETHNSIASYKTYLLEKNRQINGLEKELKAIKATPLTVSTQSALAIEQLLSSHLMTDENWNRFKQAFIAEKADYYTQLLSNLPDLTESNLRIILLNKLGLNNQETAQILGITFDAVKKAKQRLRKKYQQILEPFLLHE